MIVWLPLIDLADWGFLNVILYQEIPWEKPQRFHFSYFLFECFYISRKWFVLGGETIFQVKVLKQLLHLLSSPLTLFMWNCRGFNQAVDHTWFHDIQSAKLGLPNSLVVKFNCQIAPIICTTQSSTSFKFKSTNWIKEIVGNILGNRHKCFLADRAMCKYW